MLPREVHVIHTGLKRLGFLVKLELYTLLMESILWSSGQGPGRRIKINKKINLVLLVGNVMFSYLLYLLVCNNLL